MEGAKLGLFMISACVFVVLLEHPSSPVLHIIDNGLEIMANHTLPFWVTTEDLPDSHNRVTLTPNGGIMLSYTPNSMANALRVGEHIFEQL